jgi:molybdenum cofactor biosynthesis protein B
MPKIDETRPFIPVRIAVLTVSDTRALAEDRSGGALVIRASLWSSRLVALVSPDGT